MEGRRVFTLISQRNQRLSIFKGISILFCALAFSACTNNINVKGSFSSNIATSPDPGTDGGTYGTFTLSRIVKSSLDPNNTLDLIGDGTGAFGTLCQSSDGTTAPTATSPTVCECSFEYTTASSATQQVFTPVTYHETNMVRCSYTSIPTNITNFTVAIHLASADTYSNKVKFTFSGSGVSLDPTRSDSFAVVQRYQCRDIARLPYLLDPATIYDPIRSEDKRFTYPLNYYTTNFGGSLAQYANASGSTAFMWDCPSILNPAGYLAEPYLTSYYQNYHLNMKVYSKAALNGSKLIYPPASGVFDRSTFYLAKQPTGAFSVPVNAYMAPNIVTAENSGSNPAPIGYGASPIANGSSGQETCPDTSVSIPTGYKWVKVWLFRAYLNPRRYAVFGGTQDSSKYAFFCNPGDWAMDTTNTANLFQPIIPACDTEDNSGHTAGRESGISMRQLSGSQYLADRILQVGAQAVYSCFQLQSGGLCGNAPGPGCDEDYGDFWRVVQPYAAGGNASSACHLSPIQDPLNICTTETSNLAKAPKIPNDDLAFVTDEPNGRYDYLFVVTPPNITVKDMQDTDPYTSPSAPYQPFRYKSDTDCLSSDPDNPTTVGDCNSQNKISYGLKIHDVSSPEDPSASDPKRAGVFPVCALQKENP